MEQDCDLLGGFNGDGDLCAIGVEELVDLIGHVVQCNWRQDWREFQKLERYLRLSVWNPKRRLALIVI